MPPLLFGDAMSTLIEKKIDSESIYSGRVVKLFVDTVELPNGATSKRELVRHPGAVAIVPVDAEGRLVLVEQYRYATGKVLLEIPAGTLEPNEDPDVCANRELQEETGYKPGKLQKLGAIYLAPGYSTELIHLYLATDLSESRLAGDEDEFIDILHLSLADVLDKITNNTIQDAKTISAVMLAREHLK
jgi:ADP-ribose pyrophosphatase